MQLYIGMRQFVKHDQAIEKTYLYFSGGGDSNVLGITCLPGLNTMNWSAKLKICLFSVGWRIETLAFQKWRFIQIFAWKWSFVSFRANQTLMIQVISHIFSFFLFFASAFLTVGIKKRIIDLFWIAWFNGACLVL